MKQLLLGCSIRETDSRCLRRLWPRPSRLGPAFSATSDIRIHARSRSSYCSGTAVVFETEPNYLGRQCPRPPRAVLLTSSDVEIHAPSRSSYCSGTPLWDCIAADSRTPSESPPMSRVRTSTGRRKQESGGSKPGDKSAHKKWRQATQHLCPICVHESRQKRISMLSGCETK